MTPAAELDYVRRQLGHIKKHTQDTWRILNLFKLNVRYRYRKFGRLFVKRVYRSTQDNRYRAVCICNCTKKKVVRLSNLTRGFVTSCGCYNKELQYRHGDLVNKHVNGVSLEYNSWTHMKDRCFNDKNKFYKYYGGRGISVCTRWLGKYGFKHFLKDMGRRPVKSYSIDRIDVDGNYEPDNCRWASKKIQVFNRRKNKTWRASLYVEHYINLRRTERG